MHMTVTQMIKAAPVMITMTTSAAKRAEGAVGYSLIITLDTRSIFKTKLLNLYESAPTSRYCCQEAQLSQKDRATLYQLKSCKVNSGYK